jgi:hypothetical protein
MASNTEKKSTWKLPIKVADTGYNIKKYDLDPKGVRHPNVKGK